MKKTLFLLGLLVSTVTMVGQTTDVADSKKGWNFYIDGSYFGSVVATEFPSVNGNDALSKVYVGGKLVSEESITGSFGQGFRSGVGAGYRFSDRFGLQMSVNYYQSESKTMAQTTTDQVFVDGSNKTIYNFKSVGQIKAWDIAPALVFYLGEVKGFEAYSKIGVIVPVSGHLEIKTNAIAPVSPTAVANVYSVDEIKPNPTIGFMAALGTSYKLGKNISAFAELEYRNFTVHGKDKETTEFTVNGVDRLSTRTNSQVNTNYVDKLTTTSNNAVTNPNGVDTSKPTDDLSSYVGISGLGLTLGLKYSL